jgi:hypothetical protein
LTSEDADNHFLKEWETSRDVLKTFDDRLHDLRKYGFSFITALLTGSTILFTTYIVEPSNDSGELFPESIKAIILGVTLLLIFGLYTLDRNYRVFQKAASTRANVLERVLNIELSQVITERYRTKRIHNFVTALYLLFILGVCLLGLAVLSGTLLILLLIAAGVTSGFVLYLSPDDSLMKYEHGRVDWILDKTECKQGDDVRVIMTNLNDKPFPSPNHSISQGEVMWKLVKQQNNANLVEKNDKKIVRFGEMETTLSKETGYLIGPYQNYTWILSTKKEAQYIAAGVYCLYRRVFDKKTGAILPENKMVPLSRKLCVMEKAPDMPAKPTVHHVILKDKAKDKDTRL